MSWSYSGGGPTVDNVTWRVALNLVPPCYYHLIRRKAEGYRALETKNAILLVCRVQSALLLV